MKNVKNYIYGQVAEHKLTEQDAKKMLLEIQQGEEVNKNHDIAIIGIAGKFSSANNVDEYWQNIITGINDVREVPEERKGDMEAYLKRFSYDKLVKYNAIKEDGHLDVKYEKQGYLKEIDKFDATLFRIPPREAKAMGPEQRLFLETAYEALEDAGYGGKSLDHSKTAVFVGMDHSGGFTYKKIADADAMNTTGNWPGILASRISYIFNFKGPAVVIDTACSSGLVCVHEAIRSLNNGECDTAIAGGVSSIVYDASVFEGDVKDLESVESKKGVVRAFDNGVDGTAWGEGVGAVILKKLDKAIEDGDDIYAVIKGSAINNDGASNGITAPDAEMQEALLLAAWKDANVSPETIQYIEAHGTGTKLGDSIELKALTQAFSKQTSKKQFCGIGSVKSGIGHLVAASGLSGLIKIILMLKNDIMPASVHFTRPNRFIDFMNAPVYVCDNNKKWERTEVPRRAGISSFGFSGTNCHVVIEEYVKKQEVEAKNAFEIFTLSAKTEEILNTLIKHYINFLQGDVDLQSICYTAAVGRGHYEYRLAAVVRSKEELAEKLKGYINGERQDVYCGSYKVTNKHRETDEGNEITEGERRVLTQEGKEWVARLYESYGEAEANELLKLYIKGAEIQWQDLYKNKKVRRCHMPTYPLARERCWYEETPEEIEKRMKQSVKVQQNTIGHPLIHNSLVNSMDCHIFQTSFSPATQWELGEHKIFDNYVLPGTSYVEMTVEACKHYYESGMLIKNVTFNIPMILGEEEYRECHTILNKNEDGLKVVFISKDELGEEWVEHCECEVTELVDRPTQKVDIEALKQEILQKGSSIVKERIEGKKNSHLDLGKHWSNDDIVAKGGNEVLTKLTLAEELKNENSIYNLQVALLDNAVNEVSQGIGEGLYLPFFYKSFKYYSHMPQEFYSYIKINTPNSKEYETITFNVQMIDLEGNIFAEVTDYIIKHVNKTAEEFAGQGKEDDKSYQLKWIKKDAALAKQELGKGTVVIFKGKSPLSQKLCKQLKEKYSVIEVEKGTTYEKLAEDKYIVGDGEEYNQLFKALKDKSVSTILHLYTLDETCNEQFQTIEELREEKVKGIDSVFYITRALVNEHYSDEIHLMLITDAAYEVEENMLIKPEHRAYLAIGKVIREEYPNIKCYGIDVDTATDESQLVDLIEAQKDSYQVAYRDGQAYEEEFDEVVVGKEGEIEVDKDGVYLVTGGLGGLGLAVSKYLSSKEKVKIVLTGRSPLPGKAEWFSILGSDNEKQKGIIRSILEIEANGSQVIYKQVNVGNLEEMSNMWQEVKEEYSAIKGIFHCAGVAGDGLIITKDKSRFDQVIIPKVDGTWILGKLIEENPVDFVVLYSSMTSIFAGVGQSDYCIANNYMDAYAALLNQKGIKAIAINWPAWKEVGMAVAYGVDDKKTFISSVTTLEAFKNLEKLMATPISQVLPGRVNYTYLKENIDRLSFKVAPSIKKELGKLKYQKGTSNKQASTAQVEIEEVQKSDTIEDFLLNAWCKVLGTDKIAVYDSFSRLGGDSLMAIQLLKIIDKVYPDIVSVPDIFTYSSVVDMAEFIKEKLGENNEEEKAESKEAKEEAAATLDKDTTLESILDDVQSGDISIESVLKILE